MTPGFCHSVIPWLRDFSFFLFNTFVYEPILLKLSMNANIPMMQIFYKIKYDLRGYSRSQIMTFLIKNLPFLLFMLLIDWRNKCRWSLWNNKVWLIQRWHLPCFDLNLCSYGQLFVLVFSYVNMLKSGQRNWLTRKYSVTGFKGAYWISSNIAIAILNFSLLLPLYLLL